MRVIDSHVHFPENKIIDDGTATLENSNKGIGDTSGRAQTQKGVGFASKKHQAWLSSEKNRWESAWQFPEAQDVSASEGEIYWAKELDIYNFLKGIVFVTAGSNQFVAELVARHPGKFYGYAHHNPLLPDAAERLEKAIKEQGLRGYKILGPRVDTPLCNKVFDPIWEVAQKYEIPILIHFGIMGAAGGIASHVNINPLAIHDVAKRFPDVPFIVPHFGTGYLFEILNLCWACPNIYIDTSGSNQWMRWMPYDVTLDSLFRKFRETIGASRIIFGTDSSWFPRGFTLDYLKAQNRAMTDVGYSEDEKDMIFYRNIAYLLRIEELE
ncbi:MAG TPA: amidohydrolase family protein [Rectinema sp.]|nr:amidohydrolase family protein [Rectinema sp.]